MIAVFTGFAFAGMPLVAELGVACAVAIAVDATIVRLVLVPSLMAMFDQWNWWVPAGCPGCCHRWTSRSRCPASTSVISSSSRTTFRRWSRRTPTCGWCSKARRVSGSSRPTRSRSRTHSHSTAAAHRAANTRRAITLDIRTASTIRRRPLGHTGCLPLPRRPRSAPRSAPSAPGGRPARRSSIR